MVGSVSVSVSVHSVVGVVVGVVGVGIHLFRIFWVQMDMTIISIQALHLMLKV